MSLWRLAPRHVFFPVLALLLLASAGCASGAATPTGFPPEALTGTFEDDYGIRYEITERVWTQRPNAAYRITEWHPEARYLIAQNASTNPTDGGLWTRIDWILLDGMAPYEWAFCLTVYDAPTARAARSSGDADPGTPRTGCGGYPFSRMQQVSPEASPTNGTPTGY